MLKRQIDAELQKWYISSIRRPLLVRGARQVGKTFSIQQFGATSFENCVTINFEERPEYAECFRTLDTAEILEKISILASREINPGKTLLFLDEIQECPRAITALRYFFEKLPMLHVIAAGSLLEFIFNSPDFRMPVGRVSSLFMYPLSFSEYLEGVGQHKLNQYLLGIDLNAPPEPVFREELTKHLRKYMIVGGMPEIVSKYESGISTEEMKALQASLLQTYQADFAKYGSTAQHKYLKEVFSAVPRLIGDRCKYSNINPDAQSRDLKNAIGLLRDAKCIYTVCHSSGQGLPLESQVNRRKFKLLFMDLGLMQQALGLDSQLMFEKDILSIHRGAVAEQYIGQQLIASTTSYDEGRLYFWARDSRNSRAEVDYLVTKGADILPVEVKGGKTGRLKSLRLFLDEHANSPLGIRFSQHELSWENPILSIPLYLAEHWKRLAGKIEI